MFGKTEQYSALFIVAEAKSKTSVSGKLFCFQHEGAPGYPHGGFQAVGPHGV